MAEPVQIYRPVWCDPRFVGVLNDHSVTDLTVPAGGISRILPNDPTRWALGIMLVDPSLIPPGARVGLTSGLGSGGFPVSGTPLWFYLFQHGTIVQSEWYAQGLAGVDITLIEVRAST